MLIRALTTVAECRGVVELERAVWGYTDAEDVVSLPILIVSVKRGGILLGSFEPDGIMTGFVYSLPALKEGRATQWSHMLGVMPAARHAGVGVALKLAQRERAMHMDIDLIEWTFDPLQALNAHLNFGRLGVVVEEYEENLYGESSSPLHRGAPTDRFVAQWRLGEPHVLRRIAAIGQPVVRDSSVASAPLINPSRSSGSGSLEPGDARLDCHERRLLVEIPLGFDDMLARDPELALAWRMATRRIFQSYLPRGYRVVDFFLSREARRGHYLLVRSA